MRNQNQIQKNSDIIVCSAISFWVYSFFHGFFVLYQLIYLNSIDELNILLVLLSLFISFLLTAILITVSCKKSNNCILYISLIPSLINELIIIGILIFCFTSLRNMRGRGIEWVIFILIILILIESIPNILLIIGICTKKESNIDNNRNNSLLNNN